MSIQVACSKGCGQTIEVSDEQIQEFIDLKQPIVLSHEECPQEVEKKHFELSEYKITVTVHRLIPNSNEKWEELSSMGATVKALSFTESLPSMTAELNKQWDRITAMSQVIDGS